MKKIKLSNGVEVSMRKPKVKDMRLVNNISDELEREIAMFVNLCEITENEIDDLSTQDFKKLDEALQDFLS
jgi:enhancing lycopene biosynthesis protein 2